MSTPSGTGTGSLTGTPTTDSGTNTPTGTPTSTTPTTSPTSTTPTTSPTSNTNPTSKTTPRGGDTGTPTTDRGSSTTDGQQQSTIFTTTFITTDAGGQTIVTTSMGVTSLPDPNANQSTVAVGPIVGGVVGGVGGILLLGVVAWLMFFRTKKPDRYEDGMFDPDKNIQRPGRGAGGGAFDLGTDEIGAARVTPFVLGGGAAGAGAGAAAGAGLGAAAARRQSQQPQHPQQPLYPEMRSYNGSDGTSDFFPNPYGNAPPSAYGGVGGANLRRGHTTSSNSSGGYPASLPGSGTGGQGGAGYHTDNTEQYLMSPTTTFSSPSSGPGHHPLPPLPPGASSGSSPAPGPGAIPGVSAARAAKEREAFSNTRHSQAISNANASSNPSVNRFSQHGPLVLTNPSLPSPEGEVPPPGVVVHRDGGRVREPEPEHTETEIPPTYDSIPSDAR